MKKKKYPISMEILEKGLKNDLKINNRIVRNYKRGKSDIAVGKVSLEDYLEAKYQADYITFLLNSVLTGDVYRKSDGTLDLKGEIT